MPHYRKWAVFSPHHKQGGRYLETVFQFKINVKFGLKSHKIVFHIKQLMSAI